MPEICDNGIDDDMDGLIDLNDTVDCKCQGIGMTVFHPSSLIPNPSFEDTLCCPKGLAQLTCAKDWIQASAATSDFYHTCGIQGEVARGYPPLPLPSGDGYVGFLEILNSPVGKSYKEYVGTCLTETMKQGEKYILQFHLGFGTGGSPYLAKSPATVVLYGTEDCAELPFGGGDYNDCPSFLPEWYELAEVTVTGRAEWKVATMNFTLDRDIEAIALGPSCGRELGAFNYFLDNLILNTASSFEHVPVTIEGDICDPYITFVGESDEGLNYQWYRNGVALVGENAYALEVARSDTGHYQLRVDDGTGCLLSEPFAYHPLDFVQRVDTTVCQGDYVDLEGQIIRQDFLDTFHYPSTLYCDSMVIVQVVQLDSTVFHLDTTICPNSTLTLGGKDFRDQGDYRWVIPNVVGCDSVIYLELRWRDTTFVQLDTQICRGTSVTIQNEEFSTEGQFEMNYSGMDGCMTHLTLRLGFHDDYDFTVDTAICKGRSIDPLGPVINRDTTYTEHWTSVQGCDSLVTHRIAVFPTYHLDRDTFFCSGRELLLHGRVIEDEGDHTFDFSTADRCDSVITYHVVQKEGYFAIIDTQICEGDDLIIFQKVISEEGIYQIQRSEDVCDSTVEVHLTFRDQFDVKVDTSICSGTALFWAGRMYDTPGTFEHTFTADNGCDSTVTLHLAVDLMPTVDIEIIGQVLCYGGHDASVRISLDNPQAVLTWEDGWTEWVKEGLEAGMYPFTIGYGNGCILWDTVWIDQPDPIDLVVSVNDIPCMGGDEGQIVVERLEGGVGPFSIYVNGEQRHLENGRIMDLDAGKKTIVVEDQNGCTYETYEEVLQVTEGEVFIQASATEIVLGESVVLTYRTTGIDSIVLVEWEGPEEYCIQDCDQWEVRPKADNALYELYLEDAKGCSYHLSIVIRVTNNVFTPNVFSPNGDRINDVFKPYSNGGIARLVRFQIFDRWGEEVFVQENMGMDDGSLGWDGTFMGSRSPEGVYVYQIEMEDPWGGRIVIQGDVTLYR